MAAANQHGKEATFNFRLDPALKAAFTAAAEAGHEPAAEILRRFMRSYVAQKRRRAFETEAHRQSLSIAARTGRYRLGRARGDAGPGHRAGHRRFRHRVEGVTRGDLVTVAIGRDYGKPRPALIVQADAFAELPSVTVLRLTSDLHGEHLIRITVAPTPENGLRAPSQIMIDKAVTVPRERIGVVIGRLDAGLMRTVGQALAAFLALDTAMTV